MSALSIVIPTLGQSRSLAAVLDGLAGQDPPLQNAQVLLVLDAAATPDAVGGNGDHDTVTDVLRASVAGASGARNAGWRAAEAPVVLFLDDDIVPAPQAVAEHLAWHQRFPQVEVGVLGLVKWSPQVKVTPFMRWLESGIQFDYGTIRGTEVDWTRFYSCNVSVKREMLARVGGFDEERFPYGYEDLELARRMAEQGFRLLFNPAALGEHLKTETLDGWRRNLPRIAHAERRFTTLYPEQTPYFHELFFTAANAPAASGRPARLARYVRPSLPWIGRHVWSSYDMVCRQRLAGQFLAEWEAAGTAEDE